MFEPVISLKLISVDRDSFFSRIVSLLIQMWKGLSSIEWQNVSDKQSIQRNHKPHLFLNKQRCWNNYIILTYCPQVFPNSSFWEQYKITAVVVRWNDFDPHYNDTGLCETLSKAVDSMWYQLIPHCSTWNYKLHLNQLSIKWHRIFSPLRDFINIIRKTQFFF